jgi:hypothetical protein
MRVGRGAPQQKTAGKYHRAPAEFGLVLQVQQFDAVGLARG